MSSGYPRMPIWSTYADVQRPHRSCFVRLDEGGECVEITSRRKNASYPAEKRRHEDRRRCRTS